jgi:hypothetical protein
MARVAQTELFFQMAQISGLRGETCPNVTLIANSIII